MMASFLAVIKISIKSKAFDKEYYETVIATWSLHGLLEPHETTEAIEYLNEVFPE